MTALWLLLACAPRWWQPTDWQGDDTTATGVLCEGATIYSDATEPFWVRVSVRWAADVRMDWGSARLDTDKARVVRQDLGDVRTAGRDLQMRYHSFWVEPTEDAQPGDTVTIGPYSVDWRSRDAADLRALTGRSCTATVQR